MCSVCKKHTIQSPVCHHWSDTCIIGDRKKNMQCKLIFVLFVYLKVEGSYLLSLEMNCRSDSLDIEFHSEKKSWK